MPAVRRWRILVLTIVFTLTVIYYLNQPRESWNYNYTPIYAPLPNAPSGPKIPGEVKHWVKLPERYPVTSLIPLPTGTRKIPAVQVPKPAEDEAQKKERIKRRDAVKESFVHSWEGYEKHAWLRDEVSPLSGKYKDTFGGWAATLVDALDSLWIMGLIEDFELAVKAAETIDFTTTETGTINVFETTIRYLGGFLAAYDVSGGKYPSLLRKAEEVGELLMSVFDTPNRMPISRWDWQKYGTGEAQQAPAGMLVSELGSMSLEFTRLSQLTGNAKYYDAIARVGNVFEDSQNSTKLPGLWPVMVNPQKLVFSHENFFTLGGMSDSLYEYFPKQYLVLGGQVEQPKNLYQGFIEVAKKEMFFRFYNPENKALTASGDVRKKDTGGTLLIPRTQHLTCFTGGMVGLAAKIFERPDEMALAEELTKGCIWAYDAGVNGVMPEIHHLMPCKGDCKWTDEIWYTKLRQIHGDRESASDKERTAHAETLAKEQRFPKGFTGIDDRRYILRPEAIESVFLMLRMTGKQEYADAAWRMFQAIEKVSRTAIAAAAIEDITMGEGDTNDVKFVGGVPAGGGTKGPVQMDSMESFWLAETLKYFYLCFDEWEGVSLDEFVLNTEAHPLRRPS